MIQITVTDDRIDISGHAGAAPHGQSVPCEAVTVLCNSIAAALTCITNQADKILKMCSGCFQLNRKGLKADSELLCKSFLLSLEMVAEAYSDYIKMTNAMKS